MEYEMTEGMNDLKSDVNRQLSWDGTGDLCLTSVNAVASQVVTIAGRETNGDPTQFIDVGAVIDIVTAAGAYVAQGVSITAITYTLGATTATATLSSAVTTSATDVWIRSGSLNNEIQGLLTFLDAGTTTIFNVSRSTYISFQGNVVNANGGQLSLNLLQQGYNAARKRGGIPKMSAVFSDFDGERFYTKLLVSDRRYLPKTVGDGTFTSKDTNYLEWSGIPWCADKDFPAQVMMLPEASLKKFILAELEWADETGSYMIAQTSADSFEVRLRLFANLFLEKPAAAVAIKNYISP